MNSFLGELEIKIGEKQYTLRPTFEGIMEIETRSGLTVSELVGRFTKNHIGARDITSVIYGGIIGAADKNKDAPDFNELGSEMMKVGFTEFIRPAMRVLLAAYSGKRIEDVVEQKKSEAPTA